MATIRWLCVLFSFNFAYLVASSDIFDGLLGSLGGCEESCSKTYSVHTYPMGSHLISCRKGCRLYSIINYASSRDLDANKTLDSCVEACSEAYPASSEDRDACKLGCNNQRSFRVMDEQSEDDEDDNDDEQRIQLFLPLMSVHRIYMSFMDNVCQSFSESWSYFIQSDGSGILIVRSGPAMDFASDRESDVSGEQMAENAISYKQDVEVTSASFSDWVHCVSQRMGFPRWILCLTSLLSIFVMIWLCCATTATAPDQHISSQACNKDHFRLPPMIVFGEKHKMALVPPPMYEADDDALLIKIKSECV